jgi:hypothetical protein
MLNRVKFLQIIRAITAGKHDQVLTTFTSPKLKPMLSSMNDDSTNDGSGAQMEILHLEEKDDTEQNATRTDNNETKQEQNNNKTSSKEIELASYTRSMPPANDMKNVSKSSRGLLKKSMNDATRLDLVFLECVKSVRELLDSDRATLWLIDYHNGVLWSKVAEGIPHIRVPMDKGIVGWVCKNNQTLNIHNAYKDERFNPAVDKKTGYTTKSILCTPITIEVQHNHKDDSSTTTTRTVEKSSISVSNETTATKMVGIIQVINKNGPDGVGQLS